MRYFSDSYIFRIFLSCIGLFKQAADSQSLMDPEIDLISEPPGDPLRD